MAATRLYAQQKDSTCAVAALRSVLDLQFGVKVREDVLEALGTEAHTPIRKHGTTTTALRRMVREADRAFNTDRRWRLRIRARATWDELASLTRDGAFPLARVCGPYAHWHQDPNWIGYHMVVVLSVTADDAEVFDPGDGQIYLLAWDDFLAWWTDPRDDLRWSAAVLI